MENKKPTILLVDDDKFLLDMYSVKFTKNGMTVSTACGATEALRKLEAGEVADIIVMDVVMPTMDGIELLAKIRKDKLAPSSTMIMLTNQSQASDIEKAKALGIDGYIIKSTTIPSEVYDRVMEIYKKTK